MDLLDRVEITGRGADALDARREVGTSIDWESKIRLPEPIWFEKMARAWKMLSQAASLRSKT